MKTVMVYPGTGCDGFNQTANPSGEGRWMPHGTVSIATNLNFHGHETTVLDMRLCTDWDDVRAKLAATGARLCGVSCSMLDWKHAQEVCRIAKELRMVTVIGGLVPSVMTQEALACEHADYVVTGEGESVMVQLTRKLAGQRSTLDGSRLIIGERENLDELPFVDRTLVDYERELYCPFWFGQPGPIVTMIEARGCPYNCAYCQPAECATFPGPHRKRSPELFVKELKLLHETYHWNSWHAWTDTFVIGRDWINRFCDLYEEAGLPQFFVVMCRADIICKNLDLIERLASVGCKCLSIGFETGTQRMLDFIHKGTTVEQNYEAAEICHANGITPFGTFMLGLPTETKDEARATVRMIRDLKANPSMMFYYTPIPGTGLYDYCIEHDLLLDPERDKFDIARTEMYRPNIKGIDYPFLERLKAGQEAV